MVRLCIGGNRALVYYDYDYYYYWPTSAKRGRQILKIKNVISCDGLLLSE